MRFQTRLMPFVVLLTFFFVRSASAYIDLGTGSYVLQTLLGVLFALLYTLKIYWIQIRAFLRRAPSPAPHDKKLEQ